MTLCESCQRLRVQLLPDPVDRSDTAPPTGFSHSTAGQLLENASKCLLCNLIKDSFLRVGVYYTPKSMVDESLKSAISSPLLLRAGRQDARRSFKGGANLTSIDVFLEHGKTWSRGRFHLYAPRGSPALREEDIVEKPLLVTAASTRSSGLIQKWLTDCTSNHVQCRAAETLDQQTPRTLPRRLIQTFTTPRGTLAQASHHPRVIETDQHLIGSYVTLSHCWGPSNQRPLCTTKANVSQHMIEIPWQSLAPTFQDSVSTCVELGIQYLWIDSLCIIQDDESDWRQESAIMGKIYEHAIFNIAASSATNCTQGLFGVRKVLNLIEIPYFDSYGRAGSVSAYIEPELEKDLSSAPLSERGWVTQEYFLSRRIAHFTTHGLQWSCMNTENPRTRYMTSEFGDSWKAAFEDDWDMLVAGYTRRQLTYKSDKLIAIEGLANRFKERNGKTYYYGLWVDDLPHDLLWYSDEKLTKDIGSSIPSWTWASTTGPISFKSSVFENVDLFCGDILPVEELTGPLRIKSALKPIDDIRGPLRCQAFCFEDLQNMDFTGKLHDDYISGGIKVAPTYLLICGAKKIGWGVFDEHDRPPGLIFCLPLLKQQVWEGFAMSREQYFLWTLLVRATAGGDGYERVGWGLILVPSSLDGMAASTVYLV